MYDKLAKQGVQCYSHGTRWRKCDHEDECDRRAVQGGRCGSHGTRQRQHRPRATAITAGALLTTTTPAAMTMTPGATWAMTPTMQGNATAVTLSLAGFVGFLSVFSTPQTTDISICRRHVEDVCPTRRRRSDMSPFFLVTVSCWIYLLPTHYPFMCVGTSSKDI